MTLSSLGRDILAYLLAHPAAQDTLEGIAEWWLLRQEVNERTTAVKNALAELVARDWVLERRTVDGRVLYHLNHAKTRQIRELLSASPGPHA